MKSLAPLIPFRTRREILSSGWSLPATRTSCSRVQHAFSSVSSGVQASRGYPAQGLRCAQNPILQRPAAAGTYRQKFCRRARLPSSPSARSMISSGETASNLRKIFDFARKQPCVLFLDEFDALARSRDDSSEHNELRRVVNSLLLFIDRLRPQGFLIAATNLDHALDSAIWRRFDEVIWFDKPDEQLIARYLRTKFRNVATAFDVTTKAGELVGFSCGDRAGLHPGHKVDGHRKAQGR